MKRQRLNLISASICFVAFILLLISAEGLTQDNKTYLLQYKFKKGDNLQYKTERFDSVQGMGGEANSMTNTRYTLQTLSVQEALSNQPYSITVKTDSTWSDLDQTAAPSGGGETRMMRMGSGGRSFGGPGGGRSREQTYKMQSNGKSATNDPIISPLIVPLPEKTIAVNETWDFEMTAQERGRTTGQTTVKGQCLIYSIEKQGAQNIALIIVNSETKRDMKFNFQTEQGNVSGSSASSATATHLVYFDIDKGRITEIVSEDKTESMNESSMGSRSTSSSSKSTIKLVSK